MYEVHKLVVCLLFFTLVVCENANSNNYPGLICFFKKNRKKVLLQCAHLKICYIMCSYRNSFGFNYNMCSYKNYIDLSYTMCTCTIILRVHYVAKVDILRFMIEDNI